MGGPRMRKKVLVILIVMLSSLSILPFTALAGDEENLDLIGLTRPLIDQIAKIVFGNSLWDYAPNEDNVYGLDYIIKY